MANPSVVLSVSNPTAPAPSGRSPSPAGPKSSRVIKPGTVKRLTKSAVNTGRRVGVRVADREAMFDRLTADAIDSVTSVVSEVATGEKTQPVCRHCIDDIPDIAPASTGMELEF